MPNEIDCELPRDLALGLILAMPGLNDLVLGNQLGARRGPVDERLKS